MGDEVFYVTTPIYYPTSDPHIGNAYTTVAGDFLCRVRHLQGRETYYLTGTDEHGQNMQRRAQSEGMQPLEFLDSIIPKWKEVWAALDVDYDDFIRTTEPRHEKAVEAFVADLHATGDVYLGTYEGLYCVRCEGFKTPDELVEGKCPLHGIEPEVVKEDNYFFRLSKYRERLIELYETTAFVQPETRRNELVGKLREGLDDLSISRVSFDWGIPVPWDPKHVIYVWVDALLNYITAIGYGQDDANFERIWPADIHLIGKDILWFHCVIWPAMLMALDLPLPKTVFAHGFLLVKGEKMSKSRLNSISPHELIDHFGSDAYRYYFMREVSFGNDGSFSWESMVDRYNSDLANDFGNLASRVLNMAERYLGGRVPDAPAESELGDADRSLRDSFGAALKGVEAGTDAIAPHEALRAAWSFVRRANSYVEENAPWVLAKDPEQARRLEVVLYHLLDGLRLSALLLWPIMPRSTTELWARLGLTGAPEDCTFATDAKWGASPPGTAVTKGEPLFPRLEEAATQ